MTSADPRSSGADATGRSTGIVYTADTAELRPNMLGHYVDLSERLAVAGDLDEPWTVRLEVDGLEPDRWMGMQVAHLPRRVTDEWRLL